MKKPSRLTITLSIAALLIILALASYPRLLSQFYLYRASEMLDRAWRNANWIPCEDLDVLKNESKTAANLAVGYSSRALAFAPAQNRARLLLARAYCLSSDPKQAARQYQEYLTTSSDQYLVWAEMGFALQESGRYDDAVAAWNQAGYSSSDFFEIGEACFRAENFDCAVNWYQRVILLDPNNAAAYRGLGASLLAEGDINAALDAYQSAIDLGGASAVIELSQIYQDQNEFEQAARLLSNALAEFPDTVERLSWYESLGSIYTKLDRSEAAYQLYQQAVNEFPQQAHFLVELAYASWSATGDQVEAVKIAEKLLDFERSRALGNFVIGDLYYLSKQYLRAEEYFKVAIQANPDVRAWHWKRSINFREASLFGRAVEVSQVMVDQFPDFLPSYTELARNLLNAGHIEQAVSTVDQYLAHFSEVDFFAWVLAGDIYNAAGKKFQALAAFQQALQKNPNNAYVQNQIELLEAQP